jgi:sugar phosphate isomerase/epimerase
MRMNTNPIVISLSSFGATEVKKHGQAWFVNLAKNAGAGGVEIRSELLSSPDDELPFIAQQCHGIKTIYSCAEPLFSSNGELDCAALDQAMHRAQTVGAEIVKFSIGGGANAAAAHIQALSDRLRDHVVPVLIENDQSNAAGSIFQLKQFFRKASDCGLHLGMTFDIGNWHWAGECPQLAAVQFSDRIRYVHTKGVLKQANRWIAVPIADSQAPWKSLLDAMPSHCPWAIEFPLIGEDLMGVTHREICRLEEIRGERYVD